ncbi:hypothetical protein BDY19DRAFT_933895 [Irpex rosettiformis]|uniref:Uncharacterized protein n=1 Tax=Irpex rosettiformis TaxID=378272 RepID=A0ACB8UA53_9APHY|nr:hypothetical protein BDY19DRAFT_933895 [Irpex rosettiformis]
MLMAPVNKIDRCANLQTFKCLLLTLYTSLALLGHRVSHYVMSWLVPLVAFFTTAPATDFPLLWYSIKDTYPPLLDQHIAAITLPVKLTAFHSALLELTKETHTALLLDQTKVLTLLDNIASGTQKLKEALEEYHAEIDLCTYRMIHVHDHALISLQTVTRPPLGLYGPATPQCEKILKRMFVACCKEHRRSVLQLSQRRELCWSLLHTLGRNIFLLDSLMAEKNPDFHHRYSSNVFSNMWSVLCISMTDMRKLQVKGAHEILSQAALTQMREDIAAHIIAGRQTTAKAQHYIDILQSNNRESGEELSYQVQIKTIIEGLEELRRARENSQVRQSEPAPQTLVQLLGPVMADLYRFEDPRRV